ncbi:histone-lysine N-methyltransferase SETDB1-A [Vanacampus margaritifer]
MEGDEMEMTPDELQGWILETVQKMDVTPPDVLEQLNLLKSVLEKWKEQADRLLVLSNSVAAYEAMVKERYAFLGWEYTDADSDEDVIEITSGDGISPTSPSDSEINVWSSGASRSGTPTPNDSFNGSKNHQAKVTLTRLPESEIPSLCRKTPENRKSVSEPLSLVPSRSDNSTDDSDFVAKPPPSKKPRIKFKWPMTTSARKKTRPPVDTNRKEDKNTSCKTKPIENSTMSETNPTGNNTVGNTNSNGKNTVSQSNLIVNNTVSNAKETGADAPTIQPSQPVEDQVCIISSCCLSAEGASKVPNKVPEATIEAGMKVFAKRMSMCWQRAKVRKMITTANDKLKYLVRFHDKAKRLVSAHHLAFITTAKLEYLYVGARVVVGHDDDDHNVFRSGIVAELPSRKNHQRSLVFIDDQSALYVGLPHLHLVFAPLGNPVDDISDTSHRKFLKKYIKAWPYPPLAQCIPGQSLNVEHKGVQQSCVVQMLDCSLMQVHFVESQCKEWIYRGSWRLEHMAKMKQMR